ncbi:unnamed protein product, partial [Rhizoctonia solani]
MASPVSTEPAWLKVFGIPELAHIICATFRRRDKASLMQVCRPIFYSLLPVVWEEVDAPDALVSMIPGGGFLTYDSDLVPYVVMQLPGSLELSRFNIYAPHVKRLTLSPIYVDEYDGWGRFLACTQHANLLPNLEILYLPSPERGHYGCNTPKVETDSVNWIIAFLSSSLQTLVLTPPEARHFAQYTNTPWLDFSSFGGLMTSVAQKCPQLRSLSILPRDFRKRVPTPGRNYRPLPQGLFPYKPSEICSNLLYLSNLTSLLASPAILYPEAMITLSGLPCLESLCVVGWEYEYEVHCNHLQLPIKSFPVLKHLELNRLSWSTIANLCNATPLISGLQSMTIAYPAVSNVGSDEKTYKSLSDIIPLLAANNSIITTLTVHEYGSRQISPEILNAWSRLPLVNLHLGWSVIDYCGFDVLYSILSCLPLLEVLELSLTQDPLYLKQMREIVDLLPRLRRLRIPVKWESIFELAQRDFI